MSQTRQKDDKIHALQTQNQLLQAELDSIRRLRHGNQALKDAPRGPFSKNQYDALQNEYERVVNARNMLESRCRRYKEMLKEWRDYCKGWIEKKGMSAAAQGNSVDSAFVVGEGSGGIEVPAPPQPPADSTPDHTLHALAPTVSSDTPAIDLSYGQRQLRAQSDLLSTSVENTIGVAQTNRARSDGPNANGRIEKSSDNVSRPTTADSPQTPDVDRASHSSCGLARAVDQEAEDSPVFVSERSLKRKRHSVKEEPAVAIHEDGNIKVERVSSSPVIAVSSGPLDAIQDSLDLDDIGRSVDTPRKRQRLMQMRLLSSLGDPSKLQLPAQVNANAQQLNRDAMSYIPKEKPRDILPAQAFKTLPTDYASASAVAPSEKRTEEIEKLQRKTLRIAEQTALNDRVHNPRNSSLLYGQHEAPASTPLSHTRRGGHTEHRSAESGDNPVILRPKDPNVPPRTSTKKGRSIPSIRRDRGAAYVPVVAEDGEGCCPSKNTERTPQTPTTLKSKQEEWSHTSVRSPLSSPHSRLGTLLKRTPSAKAPFPQAKPNVPLSVSAMSPRTPIDIELSKGPSVHRAQHDFFTTPIQRSNAVQQPHLMTDPKSPSRSIIFDKDQGPPDPPEISPEREPLRGRSLDRLRLSDFKLNKYHSEYAFHESIRKHDERRKVGGCTDPFCDRCKEISRFAELTEFAAPNRSRLFGSSPLDADAAEQQLLEEYLGNDKQRLKRMDASEKNEVLKKAREKSFADMYGKHRQLHNRAVSPPGYWETEFPSTQQEAENREAAKAIDKVRIKERYDEAMRGGMWKFADE